MMFMMLISLYTSRVVLQTLGIQDFGIYNIVGGVIVLFSFLNNAMTSSVQRFLNFELGNKDIKQAQSYFSASLIIHLCLGLLVIVLGETFGVWFLETYLQIPSERENAAFWVLQFTLLGTFFGIIRTPYNAVIIAEERMNVFAILSVIESMLKLLIVFLLLLISYDKLIVYSALMSFILALISFLYYIMCRKSPIAKYHRCSDHSLYKKLLNFSIWSLFGSVANMGASQGVNIILNMFCGVTVNAAMGICNQVQGAVSSFLYSFQTAMNPQIVKSYAVGNQNEFHKLLLRTSKYSFFLMHILALPIFFCCKDILSIWLVSVPEYTVEFCKLIIIYSLLDSVQGPLWTSVQATGKIRNYQVLVSVIILANLPMTFLILFLDGSPVWALIIKVALNVLLLVFRTFYLRQLIQFPVMEFIRKVLVPCVVVAFLGFVILIVLPCVSNRFLNIAYIIVVSTAISTILFYFIGLDLAEKNLCKSFLKAKFGL